METLVVVAQHRNQYYGKNKGHGSPPSRGFRGINCRTFQSGAGLLPTPVNGCASVTEKSFGNSPSTPVHKKLSPVYANSFSEENNSRNLKRTTLKKSCSVPIPINSKVDSSTKKSVFSDELSYSELWAGPAYSNSPPPSSVPIPKFFVPPKRTVSLDLPSSTVSEITLHPIARSAPPSPKREQNGSARSLFHSTDYASATKDLCRILNLDMTDE